MQSLASQFAALANAVEANKRRPRTTSEDHAVEAVIDFLRERDVVGRKEIASIFTDVSYESVGRLLVTLVDMGIVLKVGYNKYSLNRSK